MPDNTPITTGSGLSVATDEVPFALSGTVTKTATSTTLTGSGTAFLSELSVGQVVSVPGTAVERAVVTAIASDTSLTVAAAFANTASAQVASRLQHFQRVKLTLGVDGVNDGDVSSSNPVPVGGTLVGGLTETPPSTDTASSGLNGRLARVAQRLTSLIGLLPTALGQTTKANSLAVAPASDYQQPILPVNATPSWTNIVVINTDGIAAMDVSTYRSGTLQLTGTWSATVQVQFSNDGGSNWLPGLVYGIGGDKAVATGVTGNSIYHFSIPPMSQMRIRATGFSSGTIVGSVVLSSVPVTTFALGIIPSNFVGLGDGASNTRTAPTSPLGDLDYPTFPRVYNGSTWDRQRGVLALSLLTSAARTATTNSTDQTNYNWHGLLLTVDVSSAGTGSITPSIQVKDSISGNYKTIWTAAAALVANGTYVYALAPSAASAASYTEVAQLLIGRTWRLAMVANNANTVTYSASADMVL